MKDFSNYSLLEHNTFGIDAKCRRYLEYESEEDALHIAGSLTDNDKPLLIIGGGSNLLLTKDYDSTVVRSGIKGIEVKKDDSNADCVLVRCGSGETWDDVVDYCVKNGYYGSENLSLIPGDVGASAVQNIGAYGAEVKDLIVEIEAIDLQTCNRVVIPASECKYAYRNSRFKGEWKGRFLITYVTYRLSEVFNPNIEYGQIKNELSARGITTPSACQLREVIISIRQAKLPDVKVEGNAGSFFMNPVVPTAKWKSLQAEYPDMPYYIISDEEVKIPAGWMIEQCGWKGKTVGKAGVHNRQALVLVNRGGATGCEIVSLCEMIRKDVADKFAIAIYPEVNII